MYPKRNIARSSINRREARIFNQEKKNHNWKLNHSKFFEDDESYEEQQINVKICGKKSKS